MLELREAWASFERVWVTFDKSDARSLLRGRARGARATARRTATSRTCSATCGSRLGVLRRERPSAILTTGAGVAVPFAWMGRLLGIPTVYVESVTRIEGLSLSARLIAPVATRHVRAVAGAGRARPRAGSTSKATSSRADDRRHRRHQRAALRPPRATRPPSSATEEPLLVQHGTSAVPAGPRRVGRLPVLRRAGRERAQARACSSATRGSARSCWRGGCGQRPVVVPRRAAARRARRRPSAHARAAARQSGIVTLVEDETQLGAVLAGPDVALAGEPARLSGAGQLTSEVREVLAGLGAAPFSGRAA